MSIIERQGASQLVTASGRLRILVGAPLIAPARQFVFPVNVPGEEEALQRGSIYVEVALSDKSTFLAQCAIGFLGTGVAHGLWQSPVEDTAIVAAGGYAYLLHLSHPERTKLLPIRPLTGVVQDAAGERALFVGYHHVLVCEADGELWQSGRISWEGIAATALAGGQLRGTGWDMLADEDVPFTLDLGTRALTGGGYRQERG